ncbi:hypothetical protein BD311DRAFT_758591 [Dichomitus squalens]|uniref:BTB domain-containing protein n=1 Tax=Dichomitus squalens TaxID=114155 RepID=A0A4Q9MLG5_9APHY|nr:hypothetical protein BD311DRAFT_758591 [Dichomitus squalens]
MTYLGKCTTHDVRGTRLTATAGYSPQLTSGHPASPWSPLSRRHIVQLQLSICTMASPAPSASPSSPDNDVYTVIVRGETFELYHDQITFDSPNYFTTCFLSGFAEAKDRTLRLSRHPTLFAIIVEYLSGYPILPLSSQAVPPNMDVANAHRCLLADAQYYGLQRLCALLTKPTLDMNLGWIGYANEVVDLRDVVGGKLPVGIVRREDGSVVSAHNGLPVIAYARDVVFTFVCTMLANPKDNYELDRTQRSLLIKLSYPPGTTVLHLSHSVEIPCIPAESRTPQVRRQNGYLQRGTYWNAEGTSTIREHSRVHVDGEVVGWGSILQALFDSEVNRPPNPVYKLPANGLPGRFDRGIYEWPHPHWRTPYDLGTRIRRTVDADGRQYEHWSFALWADEVLCRVAAPFQTDPHVPADASVELLRAKLRTRDRVLDTFQLEVPAEQLESNSVVSA